MEHVEYNVQMTNHSKLKIQRRKRLSHIHAHAANNIKNMFYSSNIAQLICSPAKAEPLNMAR